MKRTIGSAMIVGFLLLFAAVMLLFMHVRERPEFRDFGLQADTLAVVHLTATVVAPIVGICCFAVSFMRRRPYRVCFAGALFAIIIGAMESRYGIRGLAIAVTLVPLFFGILTVIVLRFRQGPSVDIRKNA